MIDKRILAGVSLAALAFATPALAQTIVNEPSDPDGPTGLADVVVFGRGSARQQNSISEGAMRSAANREIPQACRRPAFRRVVGEMVHQIPRRRKLRPRLEELNPRFGCHDRTHPAARGRTHRR
jgi:hypothetical protein